MALDVEVDRTFERRWWVAERAGWLVMLAIVVAALLGLTGRGGPLADAEAQAGRATITYPRVARWQAAAEMTVDFPAGAPAKVLIPAAFAERFAIETVSPEPASVTATPDGLLYRFDIKPAGAATTASFGLRASAPSGWTAARTRDPAGPKAMSFIILP